MLVQENISDELVKTYSDQGFYIKGGCPAGLYAEAIDPIELGRVYEETDILIEKEDEGGQEQ